ncbi:NlpC/P60 family protein [Clostridium gasigenes]|uniref:NlpC/P60 family protein n=1 Tax=Clostridium gasigenes TaxID=94869 RepID=UPI001C0DED7F|nr:NlpC/P60 family protein [Clostridium gasigenes]MBU3107643.1 C40 family peptidase [Clostridium gasigenes]
MNKRKLKTFLIVSASAFIISTSLIKPLEAKAYMPGGDGNSTMYSWNINGFNSSLQTLWTSTIEGYGAMGCEGRMVSGDFDGDGQDEIATFYDYKNETTGLHIFNPDALGNLRTISAWTSKSFNAAAITDRVVAGDFDGDGRDEIAALYDYGHGEVSLLLFKSNSDASSFSSTTVWKGSKFIADNVEDIVAGDFNGDGKDELSIFYDYGNGNVKMFEYSQESANKFTSRHAWEGSGFDASRIKNKVVAGDFNGDRKDEIVMFYDYGNRTTKAWTLLNDNNKYIAEETWVSDSFTGSSMTNKITATNNKNGEKDKIVAVYDYTNYRGAIFTWSQSTGNKLVAEKSLPLDSNDVPRTNGRVVVGKFDGKNTRIACMYDGTVVKSESSTRDKIMNEAYKHLGKPYVYGAKGPDVFDCSGFTSYVYRHAAGIEIGGNTWAQVNQGRAVAYSELQPGDLVFTYNVGHVGIYVGNGNYINAPQEGDVVKISPIREFHSARRIL